MKIIYNVTVNIDDTVHDEWLIWIKEHIHQVLQYRSFSRATLEAYYKEDANQLSADGFKRFSDKMVAFRTELEVIDEFSIN